MRGLNRVMLVGNLGNLPQVKQLSTGTVVAKISLATTEVYRSREGENRSETQWHTILLWGPLARLAEKYLKKGSLVLVEGKLRYRSYEEEGVGRRYVTEIIGDRLLMLDKPGSGHPAGKASEDPANSDEELPF